MRIFLFLPLIFFLSACASLNVGDTRPTIGDSVLAEGYRLIDDYYLEPVPFDIIGHEGLRRVLAIDPALDVREMDEWWHVTCVEREIARFRPPGDDPDRWADLIGRIVTATHAVSKPLRDASSETVLTAALNGVTDRLDAYTRYEPAENARFLTARREGFAGVGIEIDRNGPPFVIDHILTKSPASMADIRIGDRLIGIDDTPIDKLDPVLIQNRLRGPEGTNVQLMLIRENTSLFTVDLVRAQIMPETVRTRVMDGILWLSVTHFNIATASHLKQALKDHPKPVGIALDLRGNPGGILNEAVAVADLFLNAGLVMTAHGRHKNSHQIHKSGRGTTAGGRPVVVVIDDATASAAEVLAAALRDRGRALLVGVASRGKGDIQNVKPLSGNGDLYLTWARIHTPGGETFTGTGLVPDVCLLPGRNAADIMTLRKIARQAETLGIQKLVDPCRYENPHPQVVKEIIRLLMEETVMSDEQ
ncbi:MAG: S41 family peptidase [Pseudomonadota bacterium]|nr:S41 family peptidase [Pseudomonadota bacterium]